MIDDDKPDFSFKKTNYMDIKGEVDRELDKRKEIIVDKEKEFKLDHITDKIRFAKDIKENSPKKDFMKIDFAEADYITVNKKTGEEIHKKGVSVTSYHDPKDPSKPGNPNDKNVIRKIAVYEGIFPFDLNIDAYWWFVRSCNVFPTILDQGIRTHLDIKKSHEPEKRKLEIPIFLIGAVVCGIIFILVLFSLVL